jgi:hypothetical protein
MPTMMSGILRANHSGPLHILCVGVTHERYESNLARTGHQFFVVQGSGLKAWNPTYAPLPANYTLLDGTLQERQLPIDLTYDLVLCQSRVAQWDIALNLTQSLNRPLICLEHVLPNPQWSPAALAEVRQRQGTHNVFIADYSRQAWGLEQGTVIEHGIDTDLFHPGEIVSKARHCLAVVNYWQQRDRECGYTFWTEATAGIPTAVLGSNPGLSEPAASLEELAFAYRSSLIFVNTSQISPVPTTLLEAMASGSCVVTTRNPMIASVINHGQNGFLCETPAEMRTQIQALLDHPEIAEAVGRRARDTILSRFGLDRFVTDWNALFHHVASLPPTGVP